jgi:predicted nuclease of predicted toxin-antitoxin system
MGLATAEDTEILEKARQENRIVVTLDSDFHTLLALTGAVGPSVIRVRIEGLRAQPVVVLLQKVLAEWEDDLNKGVLLTVQADRIRMHRLPIVPT